MKGIRAHAGYILAGVAIGIAVSLFVAWPQGVSSQTGYPSQAQAYAQQEIGRELSMINQKLDQVLQGNRRIMELLNRTWENTRRSR
jgi:hypothetical protein